MGNISWVIRNKKELEGYRNMFYGHLDNVIIQKCCDVVGQEDVAEVFQDL